MKKRDVSEHAVERDRRRREHQERDTRGDHPVIPRHTGPGGCGRPLPSCTCTSNNLRK